MKVTRAQLAGIFGVTPPAVDGWVRRGCPVAEPSKGVGRGNGAKFWTPDVLTWWAANVAPRVAGEGLDAETLKELRTRRERAETELAEIELAERKAELMTVAQYEDAVSGAFARVGARLKSVAPKLAAAAVGVETLPDGLARMEPIVEQLLQELAGADDVPDETALPDQDAA